MLSRNTTSQVLSHLKFFILKGNSLKSTSFFAQVSFNWKMQNKCPDTFKALKVILKQAKSYPFFGYMFQGIIKHNLCVFSGV